MVVTLKPPLGEAVEPVKPAPIVIVVVSGYLRITIPEPPLPETNLWLLPPPAPLPVLAEPETALPPPVPDRAVPPVALVTLEPVIELALPAPPVSPEALPFAPPPPPPAAPEPEDAAFAPAKPSTGLYPPKFPTLPNSSGG